MKKERFQPLRLDRVIKARAFFMAPWNINNAFVIMWGMGDGCNGEDNSSEGAQNTINFTNTEKSQIDAIAKILDLKDNIYEYPLPLNPDWKIKYSIAWSDQILSNYLHNIGFRVRKTDVGAHFPSDFPNDLIDVGAYGFWLANGGVEKHGNGPRIYFYACKEFLIDFQRELEAYVNFPESVGSLNLNRKTLSEKVDVYVLRYGGKNSFRVLSAMFKRTADICYSEKRHKAIELVSNYTNSILDRRDRAKKTYPPHKVQMIAALYDALDLMDDQTRERYLAHCEYRIDEIRIRAEENWYLRAK